MVTFVPRKRRSKFIAYEVETHEVVETYGVAIHGVEHDRRRRGNEFWLVEPRDEVAGDRLEERR